MAHINLNGTQFPVDTLAECKAACAAMLSTGTPYVIDFLPVLDSDGDETGERLESEPDPKAWALAQVLDCLPYHCGYGSGSGINEMWESSEEPGVYLVLDESERDEAWELALDSYIDECILPECPDIVKNYFDREKWIEDTKHDGAGHALASYDDDERETTVDGVWYYVYRVN